MHWLQKSGFALVLILVNLISLLFIFPAFAVVETKSSPNYLIILVHGINSNHWIFKGKGENRSDVSNVRGEKYAYGDLKGYLENELSLKGYVYSYTFSERDGSVELQGKELGKRDHDNLAYTKGGTLHHKTGDNFDLYGWETGIEKDPGQGNSWLEQAREDFKGWYANQHPPMLAKDVPESVIPKKYIIIAHSMGGLAARSYISSDYYQNDVAALISIASQHLGSNAATTLKRIAEFYEQGKDKEASATLLSLTFMLSAMGWDEAAIYTGICSLLIPVAYSAIDNSIIKNRLGWYPDQPGAQDMEIKSSFMGGLNSKNFVNGDPIKVRFISDHGVPTPSGELLEYRYAIGPGLIEVLFSSDYWNELPTHAKLMALYLSLLSGAVINQDGDIYGTKQSHLGQGLTNLSGVDLKTFSYMFGSDEDLIKDAILGISAAVSGTNALSVLTGGGLSWMKFGIIVAGAAAVATIARDRYENYLTAHGLILRKVYEEKLIDKALEDFITVGGKTNSAEVKSNISASALDSPTASYSAPEQAFVLLSDLDKNGNPADTYHTVTIEAFTEGGTDSSQLFPIEVNGVKKWVSSISVKERPTAIKGVINTFLPQKLKAFQYSENFSAWENISEVDEWGNFTLKDLSLAEGQNVIAFNAESWVGNKTNQQLKIILNTIPILPSKFQPQPNYYTSDATPTISVEFNKSEYLGNYEQEKITIKEMFIDGEQVNPQVSATMEAYHPWAKASYQIPADKHLSEGEHTVAVKAESNVGLSQGIWGFYVDTTSPTISMETLTSYSPRAPTTIRYSASDETSPIFSLVRCDLYDSNNNLVNTIATAESLSKGENFFSWDGKYGPLYDSGEGEPSRFIGMVGEVVPDGQYKVKIKVFDLAGNYALAEQPLAIDSTSPTVTGISLSPNPLTSNSNTLNLTSRITEKSTVTIKMINTSNNNATTAYLTKTSDSSDKDGFPASYTFDYTQAFMSLPEDGLYRVEVMALDEAGNESSPVTLEAVKIDRTPPTIYSQSTNPYVLSNTGNNQYKTTLSYQLTDAVKAKVKLYHESTGELLKIWEEAPSSQTTVNQITWDGSSSEYGKGSYQFQIIAEDEVGNSGIAYASCVKDGIAPVISSPAEDGREVYGTISLRGTAIDPDWTNDRPFKWYQVYYAPGVHSSTSLPVDSSLWKGDFIEVPLINRDPSSSSKNQGIRPIQDNSTLAYLYTNYLENGDYTLLLLAEEEGGEALATTRVIKINNDSASASSFQNPYVQLQSLPTEVSFKSDDSVKLPLSFINSIKPANVYVEISKAESQEEIVFFKYFPNVLGSPLIGKPDYQAGADLGYFFWSDEEGFHLRWSSDSSSHKFTGNIMLIGKENYSEMKTYGNGISLQSTLISWDTTLAGSEGGIDFKLTSGQVMITAKIDEDPNSPSVYADRIYLGLAKVTQTYLPLVVDVASQQLIDVSQIGQEGKTGDYESYQQTVEWEGKLDSGTYVDNGNYIIRVRAEGVDGLGVASDEAIVHLTTPFQFTIKEVTPSNRQFSTLSSPDRISVFYNVSKDSWVTAKVYDNNGSLVAKIVEGEKVLGNTNSSNAYSLSWRGNYPDPESGQIVTSGSYKIILTVSTQDGSESKSEIIEGISIVSFSSDSSVVYLEPLGEEIDFHNGAGVEKIRWATGDSPYYFEAQAAGRYYAPKDFSYTLSAAGKQRFTAYPYVPFAGLMHRGFQKVKIQVDVLAKIRWTQYGYVFLEGWKGYQKEATRSYSQKFDLSETASLTDPISATFSIWDFKSYNEYLLGEVIGEPLPHFEGIDLEVAIRPADDSSWELDRKTIASYSVSSGGYVASEKGIFKNYPAWESWSDGGFGRWIKFSLQVAIADNIKYSRLTNRFVPGIGFVNAQNKTIQDFTQYLTDINQGLGFPGEKFFKDPNTKLGESYKPIDQIVTELQGISDWKEKTKKLEEMAEEANLLGYNDSLSSSLGYDSYLSGEYFEFISINPPDEGEFEYTNNSSVVSASTDLTYYVNANPLSPFEFKWPLDEAEISTFKNQQKEKQKTLDPNLGGNPQNYTGYTAVGTWWELDSGELNQRRMDTNNTKVGSGQVRFDKNQGKSVWESSQSVGELLTIPDYVNEANYSIGSNTAGIITSLTSSGKNGLIKAEDQDTQGVEWSTANDDSLLAAEGKVKSGVLTFNEKEFLGEREVRISDFYQISEDYQSASALKYTFLKYNPFTLDGETPVDNPNLLIADWQIRIKDKTDSENQDLELKNINWKSKRLDDNFSLKLKLEATEVRYVEIKGSANGPYELLYFDGSSWNTIYQSPEPKTGRLAWWNVSRLNGKYTVLLRSGNYIATQDISLGTLVKKDEAGYAASAYQRAQLKLASQAFINGSGQPQDQLVTITPVTMEEITIRNRPIILTHGPIVEIKPSPWKFALEPEDKRPTLRFIYTFEDLAQLGLWNSSQALPQEGQTLGLNLNIHQVTSAGDLQIVSNNQQETFLENGELHYVFSAPLDHFSTYALLLGKFSLSAPIVFADRYITNQDTVTIYGTAEPDSILQLYVKTEDVPPDPQKGEIPSAETTASSEKGEFKFEKVKLLTEGENYLYVTSHLKDSPEIMTLSDVTIVKDTIPPQIDTTSDLSLFSPNGDGKFDEIDFRLKSNEKGKFYFQLTTNHSQLTTIFNQEISSEANEEIRLLWKGETLELFRRNANSGIWDLSSTFSTLQKISDGDYQVTIFAIDEAGNIGENIIQTAKLDTTPPRVTLEKSLSKFSPDGNGKFDKVTFEASANEKGKINFQLTTNSLQLSPVIFNEMIENQASTAVKFTWNHQALTISTSEVLKTITYATKLSDGIYTVEVTTVDEVENRSPPATVEVLVDLTPPELLSFLATPEIFSPNSDGLKDTTTIRVEFSEPATASIEVWDSTSKLTTNHLQLTTVSNWIWDGMVDGGRLTADGNYRLKLVAEDEVGNAYNSSEKDKDLLVTVDTTSPTVTVQPNLYVFSPNGDGKYDYVEFTFKSSENGEAVFSVNVSQEPRSLFAGSVSENAPVNITWGDAVNEGNYNYFASVTDLAGNSSKVITGEIMVDSAPPTILSLKVEPNPFTPNGDGVKDTTTFSYQFSEPTNVITQIYREDGALFRRYEGQTEKFSYPTVYPTGDGGQTMGDWTWDGKGSHGELLGGTFAYLVYAEDNVGNITSSEINSVIVDIIPSLIPYAYAQPDPFSAVSSKNNFTEIKYYLSRDNLEVSVDVLGRENEVVKSLVREENQDKGEQVVKWYGDFENGYRGPVASNNKNRVYDGSYEFQVKALDPDGGEPAIVSNTVLVDNTPPTIVANSVQIDYTQKTATLTYTLSEKSTVEVALYDIQGSLIATLVTSEAKEAGEYSLIFQEPATGNGQPETGNQKRYFRIFAQDQALNEYELKTDSFALTPEEEFQIANHYATPNPFTPNSDGHTDQTRISYRLSGGVTPYQVSFYLLNPTGSTIKKIIENESQSAGTYSFYWSGEKDVANGQKETVTDGYYEYQIIAEDGLGAKVEARGLILAIPTRPSVDLSTSLPVFSPNGDGTKDTLSLNYSLDYPLQYITAEALVKLEVLNSTGEAVWDKTFNHTAGSYVYEYNGLTASRLPLTAGNYYVKASAEDSLGTTAIPKVVTFEVDNQAPEVTIQSLEPNPFSPNGDGVKDSTIVTYTISESSSVSLNIESRNSVTVTGNKRGIVTDKRLTSLAIPTYVWDGQLNGEMASDGNYQIIIIATDEAGNTGWSSTEVKIDTTKPSISLSSLPTNTSQESQTILGTTEPEAIIELYQNEQLIGTATADAQGKFSFSINLSVGSNTFKLLAADAAGNNITFSEIQSVNYDPEVPVIANLSVNPSPAKAGPLTLTFTVFEALASNPLVKINGNLAEYNWQQATANNQTSYTYIYDVSSADQQGLALISIEATDLAQNQTLYHSSSLLTIDTVSPIKPTVYPLKAYTNLADLIISGEAEPDSTLKIYQNNELVKQTVADSNGFFQQEVDLESESNSFSILSLDSAGNQSESSDLQTIILDTQNPVFSNVEINPHPAKAGRAAITFTSSKTLEVNPTVTVNNQPASFSSLTDLTYTYIYQVSEGDQQGAARVEITGFDLAGNSSSKISQFTIDTLAPEISDLSISPNPAKSGPLTLTFTVFEALASNPLVKINGNLAEYNWQQATGNNLTTYTYIYDVSSSDQQGETLISIEATDLAQNQTTFQSDQLLTIDTIVPASPTLKTLSPYANLQLQKIEGSAEGKVKIKIYNNDLLVLETTANEEGNFVKDFNLTLGTNQIFAVAIDSAGNKSLPSETQLLTLDQTPPIFTVKTINPTLAKEGAVFITFEVSEELKEDPIVKVNDQLASLKNYANFIYTYEYLVSSNADQGTAQVEISGLDLAGNQNSTPTQFTIDTFKPEIANLNVAPNPAKSGPLTISFSVSETLESNPTVKVNGNLATYYLQLTTNNQTSYTYTYQVSSSDQQGEASISIEVTDLAQNQTSFSSTTLLTIDTIAPLSPVLKILSPNTNLQRQIIEGTTEGRAKIKIYHNDLLVLDTTADEDGNFKQDFNLTLGTNQIFAVAIDSAGNKSETSLSQTIVFETEGPVFSNLQISPNPAKTGAVTISFTASETLESHPKVEVNGNLATFFATADKLHYTYHYEVTDSDPQGSVSVLLEGYDLAHNLGQAVVYFEIDTINPSITNLSISPNPAKAGPITISFSVSETLESNPQVTVNGNLATYHLQLTTNNQTTYTYTYQVSPSDQQGSALISLEATDLAQNQTLYYSSSLLTIDTIAPAKPIITLLPRYVNGEKIIVSGEAEEGSLVKIFKDEVLIKEIVAENTFSQELTLDLGQNSLYVISQDAAGNQSDPSDTQVIVLDKTIPIFTVKEITPNPAKAGLVYITFEASEELKEDPIVKVNDQLASLKNYSNFIYTYEYSVSDNADQGTAQVEISGLDLAGNQNSTQTQLTIDTFKPEIANLNVAPNPAKAGPLTISFSVSETLASNPTVKVNGNLATYSGGQSTADSEQKYIYTYNVSSSDQQGSALISLEATDLAQNQTTFQSDQLLTVDTISPTISDIEVTPEHAKAGPVTISFSVSETLESNPTVKVNGNLAAYSLQLTANSQTNYTYTYNINSSDLQGTAVVSIQGSDLAKNSESVITYFEIDTIGPNIANISVSPNFAKDGPVNISFAVSETLESDPTVKVNGNLATYSSQLAANSQTYYIYTYDVTTTDQQGEASIFIEAQDLAGNVGEVTSSGDLVIDLEEPKIVSQSISQAVLSNHPSATIKSTEISYELEDLTGIKDWELNIVNSAQEVIGKKTGKDRKVQVVWEGKNDAGEAVASGDYYYYLKAFDQAGNILQSTQAKIEIDNDPPLISFMAPVNDDWLTNSSYDLYATITDNHLDNYTVKDWNNRQVGEGSGGVTNEKVATINCSNLEGENYRVTIAAEDAVGLKNSISQTYKIDNLLPSLSNLDINVTNNSNGSDQIVYAKLNSEVTIDFSVDETYLAKDPEVWVGSKLASPYKAKMVYSSDRVDYYYSYTISADDTEGTTPVTIELTDLGGNETVEQFNRLTVDKTNPEIRNFSVNPNPAKVGTVSINFQVSETLKDLPKVYVRQNGASSSLAYGLSPTADGYEAKYNVFSGYDGPALITVEVSDLANNFGTSTSNILTIDTLVPFFSNLQTEIVANPEFSKYAKEGSEVSLRFQVSESLKFNPEVKINNQLATYNFQLTTNNQTEYTYLYAVTDKDTDGTAEITISGYDLADNVGSYLTTSPSESFVIDLTSPTVQISDTSSLIANPSPFSCNADPAEGYDKTTLFYGISESGYVWVKVYKVLDGQDSFVKSDFQDSNLIATLVNGSYSESGGYSVIWKGVIQFNQNLYDKNNNNFADPGMYAFVVEVKDKAGNVTEKKWGGTVWIQDNVLTLAEPDQAEIKNNPLPKYISPAGNSSSAFKESRIYFRINLSSTPEVVEAPQKIEAEVIEASVKKVGYYSVKILDSSGNLVRNITTSSVAYSGTLISEVWDGKDSLDQIVSDGTYQFVIDVKDFTGNSANNNPYTKYVIVDNSSPEVNISSASRDYFSPGNTNSDWHSTEIRYQIKDSPPESDKVTATIDIYKGSEWKATLQPLATLEVNTSYSSFTKEWQGEGTGNPGTDDGTYTYQITTIDQAGNSTISRSTVVVDRISPTNCLLEIKNSNGEATEYINSESLLLSLSATDATTGLAEMRLSNDNSSWGSWQTYASSGNWSLASSDGLKTVYVQFRDPAGNWTQVSDTVTLDKTPPSAPIISQSETNWSKNNSFTIDWTNPWDLSPIVGAYYQLGSSSITYTTAKPITISVTEQGGQTFKFWLKDQAGNSSSANYASINLRYDGSSPNTPNILVDSSHTPENSWSNHSSPYLSWGDPGDSGGSGVSSYQGQIDGGSWSTVSSPWHLSSLSEGEHLIRLKAIDYAGNESSFDEVKFKIDTQKPGTPSLSSNLPTYPNWSTSSSLTVSWNNPGDSGSGVNFYEISFDGGSWSNIGSSTSWSGNLSEGSSRTVSLRAVDTAGNIGDSATLTFRIDTSNPYFSSGPSIDNGHTPSGSWSSHNSPYLTFSAADSISGVNRIEGYLDGAYQETLNYSWHPTLSDGYHYLFLRIYDNAGRYVDSSTYTFYIDTTPPNSPSLSISHTPANSWSNHNSPYFTWSDPGDSGSGVSYYQGFIDSVYQGTVSSGWHPTLSDGSHTVFVRAVDGVGYSRDSSTYYFYIDTQSPYVSQPSDDNDFNPYTEGSTTISFTAYDQGSSGLSTLTAKIKYGSNTVKDLSISSSGNSRSITWYGTNNSGDYENEGDYTLEISATDVADNSASSKTSTIKLRDDVRITNNSTDSNSPYLTISGNTLTLKWVEGGLIDTKVGPVRAYAESTGGWGAGPDNYGTSDNFVIDHKQNVEVYMWAYGNVQDDRRSYYIVEASSGNYVWGHHNYHPWDGATEYVTLDKGTYYLIVRAGAGWWSTAKSEMKVWYYDREGNQYTITSSNLGQSWGGISGPQKVDDYPNPTQSVEQTASYGNTVHKIRASSDYNIYYSRSNNSGANWSNEVSINPMTKSSSAWYGIPTITVDSSSNAYVAWTDWRNGYEIYFQKIPYNFARINGTAQGSAVAAEQPVETFQATLEAPVLLEPEKGKQDVKSLRPVFKWKHKKGKATEYKLQIAKNDSFTLDLRTLSESANSGSVDKNDPTLYYFTDQIHEFDQGLDRNTDHYWRVIALTTNEAITSEVWSFKIQPDLTISGITNYPNPFNPHKEKTKIRYRLGTDVDEVKIRIYDITGALVNELTGTTLGEWSSIWNKYNDVEWDGRNGRGDMVVNGIYPFEVIARLGDKSVSGRGKVAILK